MSSFAQNCEMNKATEEAKRDRIVSLALGEAIKYGITSSAVIGTATLFATFRYKRFNQLTSISAKVSFPVMVGLAVFSITHELTMRDAQIHPGRWGMTEYVAEGKITRIPVHHRIMNYIYDNPFRTIIVSGIPFAALIFRQQMNQQHLTLSQKIMHSRVYAQAGIITMLLSTMAFREYMDRHGRFPEPKADDPK
jgi:hypothetical protein